MCAYTVGPVCPIWVYFAKVLAPNGELARLSVARWEKQVANVDQGTTQENVSQGSAVSTQPRETEVSST